MGSSTLFSTRCAPESSGGTGWPTPLLVIVSAWSVCACSASGPKDPFIVVRDGLLGPNIELGVDTSEGDHSWVRFDQERSVLRLQYPRGQQWGAATFLIGLDDPGRRVTEDFRAFNTLQLVVGGTWADVQLSVKLLGLDAEGVQTETQPCSVMSANPGSELQVLSVSIPDVAPASGPNVLAAVFAPAQIVVEGEASADIQVKAISLFQSVAEGSSCIEAL